MALLLACSTAKDPSSSGKYVTLQGSFVVEPQLEADGERLFIYLQSDAETLVCLARNEERKEILAEVRTLLILSMGQTTYIYGSPVEKPIEEILSGVDYEIYAIGVYIPSAKKYRVIVTGYGDSFVGAMSSVNWRDFIQGLLKKGVDGL